MRRQSLRLISSLFRLRFPQHIYRAATPVAASVLRNVLRKRQQRRFMFRSPTVVQRKRHPLRLQPVPGSSATSKVERNNAPPHGLPLQEGAR